MLTTLTSAPSAPREAEQGDVIDRKYRLDRCLGEGGQGCVWQALNLSLDLPVAIKLVHGNAGDCLMPERVFREARAAAMLGHPLPPPRNEIELRERILFLGGQHFVERGILAEVLFDAVLRPAAKGDADDDAQAAQRAPGGPQLIAGVDIRWEVSLMPQPDD